MNTKKKIVYLMTVLMAGTVVSAAPATIIDWGGVDYVTENRLLVLPTATNDVNGTTRTWEYSPTIAISPSIATYSGPAFYGALLTNHTSGARNFSQAQVTNLAGGDRITFGLNNVVGNSDPLRIQGLVFFKQNDFINNNTGPVSFDATSSATITLGLWGGTGAVRAAVMNNGTWYLSNTSVSSAASLAIANLSTETFASWSPTGAPLSATPGTFSTAGNSFANIQAVGYYFDISRTNNIAQFGVTDVVYTAIPEPGTLALFGIVLGTAVLFLRRKKNV